MLQGRILFCSLPLLVRVQKSQGLHHLPLLPLFSPLLFSATLPPVSVWGFCSWLSSEHSGDSKSSAEPLKGLKSWDNTQKTLKLPEGFLNQICSAFYLRAGVWGVRACIFRTICTVPRVKSLFPVLLYFCLSKIQSWCTHPVPQGGTSRGLPASGRATGELRLGGTQHLELCKSPYSWAPSVSVTHVSPEPWIPRDGHVVRGPQPKR